MEGVDTALVAGAARAALTNYVLRPAKWTPQPHQIPPPGNWYGWLLNAGRGAGKSRTCSQYVIDHVKGPPCLPGAAPHWIGIIAPTLGDAATSCFSGPSGIGTHDPTAKLSGGLGGAIIKWSNGSQAKLFGASTPEDVERLRAGGNTCLIGDTLIRTEHGETPIKLIRAGDMVWTRNGLRRVLKAGQTGVRTTLIVTLESGRTLQLTDDHEVWIDGKWREAQFLKPDDTLTTWHITSNMTEFVGTNEKMGTTRTQVEDVDYFTDLSGSNITAQSHVGTTFTTALKMTVGQSTSPDSKCSHIVSTPANILDVTIPVTHELDAQRGNDELNMTSRVSVVENLCAPGLCHYDTAPSVMINGTKTVKFPAVHARNGCAWCAEHGSQHLNAVSPKLAHDRVRHVSRETRALPVYDLLVEHDHEFFANDVLVANCLVWAEELAAWRYLQECYEQMRFGLRSGPRPHWIASTTPKPKPLIKKLVKNTPKNVVVTHATTHDNPHLEQHIRDALFEEYSGRDIGRQELEAAIMEQDEAALWRRGDIEQHRVKAGEVPDLIRVTVGVDPSGGAGEQGIVVAGKYMMDEIVNGRKQQRFEGYVLDDRTCRLAPAGWGRRAVQAALDWEADDIVVETNFGGDMASATIRDAALAMGISIPVKIVTASRGKRVRAEPVSALSVRGQWHHAGTFEELEDQLCTWSPEEKYSPDRLDAMVWTAWHNKIISLRNRAVASMASGGAMSRVIG